MKNYISLICLGVVTAAALLTVTHISKRKPNENKKKPHQDKSSTDCIDGGVQYYPGTEAPKSVASRVIERFECEGSYSFTDESGNENMIHYTASIKAEGTAIRCTYKEYDRFGYSNDLSFTADRTVTDEVYGLFARHDLAQYNGISYTVSGLPEGYGSKLSIDFEGGEYVYSYNNQTPFLSDEFGVELAGILKRYADTQDAP